jgi:hypothetical protein
MLSLLLHLISVSPSLLHVNAAQTQFIPTSTPSGFPTDPYAPMVFNSLNGLLKTWSQAYSITGGAIVPGIIPAGTLLYHGDGGGRDVDGLEWFA